MLAVKVIVDGGLDHANWVGWLLVQVDTDLLEDGIGDVVSGVVCDHLCSGTRYGQAPAQCGASRNSSRQMKAEDSAHRSMPWVHWSR